MANTERDARLASNTYTNDIQGQIQRISDSKSLIKDTLAKSWGIIGEAEQPAINILADHISNIPVNQGKDITVGDVRTDFEAGYYKAFTIVVGDVSEEYPLMAKSFTPTKQSTVISPDPGYYGLSSVTVGPIPSAYQDVTRVDATAETVLYPKYFVDSKGTVVQGNIRSLQQKSVLLTKGLTSYTFERKFYDVNSKEPPTVSVNVQTKQEVMSGTNVKTVNCDSNALMSSVTVTADKSGTFSITQPVLNGSQYDVVAKLDKNAWYDKQNKILKLDKTNLSNSAPVIQTVISETFDGYTDTFDDPSQPFKHHIEFEKVLTLADGTHPDEEEVWISFKNNTPSGSGAILVRKSYDATTGNFSLRYNSVQENQRVYATLRINRYAVTATATKGYNDNILTASSFLKKFQHKIENGHLYLYDGFLDEDKDFDLAIYGNVTPENIRSRATVCGVAGTFSSSSTVSSGQQAVGASDILIGKSAFLNGAELKGSMANLGGLTTQVSGLNATSGGLTIKTVGTGYTTGGNIRIDGSIFNALAAI